MSRAEIVRNLLRAFATLLVLGLIFTLVNPQAVWETLRNADPLLVGVACALFLAACFISAGVWILMLRAVGCSTGVVNACSLNLVGFFFNSLIPSGLGGDVWRAWAFARQEEARPENRWRRATLGMSLATVLAERWVAFVALATLTVLTLPFALPMVEDLRLPLAMFGSVPARAAVVAFSALMASLLAASVLAFSPLASRGREWLARRAVRETGGHFAVHVDELLAGLLDYRGKGGAVFLAMLLNLASPIVESVACWLLARAVGIEIGLLAFMVLTPVLRMLHHVPLTIDAVGVQDVAVVAMVAAFGVSAAQGVALSLLIHAAKVTVSALGVPVYAGMLLRPGRFGFATQESATAG